MIKKVSKKSPKKKTAGTSKRPRGKSLAIKTDNEGLLQDDDVRTGFISGVTFKNKPIQYSVVDGMAVFEGCIVLGTVEEMEGQAAAVQAGEPPEGVAFGVGITGEQYRWPNRLMPYTIDPNLPNQNRVHDAIAHWQQNTDMTFVKRTSGNESQYPNWVNFRPANGCWSHVGMRGGKQDIGLAAGCGLGATIHEIGHAFGLWHEQSREDRDQFITINWQNITPGREHNFNQHITDGDDYGPYDYGSIMHYGRFAFTRNNQPTIVPIQQGVTIGQRNGLSTGDIAAIQAMYATKPFIERVKRYSAFLYPNAGNSKARINLYCDTNKLYLIFNEGTLPTNSYNVGNKIGVGYENFASYQAYLDLVRNEGPISVTFNPDAKSFVVYAASELPGEGELSPP